MMSVLQLQGLKADDGNQVAGWSTISNHCGSCTTK
jgi:hypothetical protein